MRPLIRAVHNVLIGPFEIECIDEGFAQAPVLEFLASRVEEPALCARRGIIGHDVAPDSPFADSRKVVARCPRARGKLLPEKVASGGETLEGNFAIAVVLITQNIEVVLPAADRQIGT